MCLHLPSLFHIGRGLGFVGVTGALGVAVSLVVVVEVSVVGVEVSGDAGVLVVVVDTE